MEWYLTEFFSKKRYIHSRICYWSCPLQHACQLGWRWGELTHRGSVMYISENWVIIGSGNGLAHIWCQAITCTNDDILSIIPLRTNLREFQIKIQKFLSRKWSWNCNLHHHRHLAWGWVELIDCQHASAHHKDHLQKQITWLYPKTAHDQHPRFSSRNTSPQY